MVDEQQLGQDLQDKLQVTQPENQEEESELTQLQQKDIEVMSKLEDFCSSAEFTTLLGNFADEHAAKFSYTEQEQSLECYQIWMDFKNQIDGQLEEFISGQEGEVTCEQIMESMERINKCDPGFMSCIDYLMAAADYEDFVRLMLDFRGVDDYEYEEGDLVAQNCAQQDEPAEETKQE